MEFLRFFQTYIHDRGPQYRSIIFYQNNKQKTIIESKINEIGSHGVFVQVNLICKAFKRDIKSHTGIIGYEIVNFLEIYINYIRNISNIW